MSGTHIDYAATRQGRIVVRLAAGGYVQVGPILACYALSMQCPVWRYAVQGPDSVVCVTEIGYGGSRCGWRITLADWSRGGVGGARYDPP